MFLEEEMAVVAHKNPSRKTTWSPIFCLLGRLDVFRTKNGLRKTAKSVKMLPAALAYHSGSRGRQFAGKVMSQNAWTGTQPKMPERMSHSP